jgi:tRNA(Ile2) C34 agmatinyltransferase TiaS
MKFMGNIEDPAADDTSLDPFNPTEEAPGCPICDGPGIKLGSMGKLTWFRCRNCGGEYNAQP